LAKISEEVLENIDIVDVISRYVTLKRAWSNFSGLCPFHQEKTPSFMVSPQKQIFKCFGCGKWWNAITFIREIERVDFWDCIKILAKDANIDLTKFEKNQEKYAELNQWKEKIKREHKLTQQFYTEALNDSKEAKEYLYKKRKLDDEIIKMFGVWYAPDSHYSLLQFLKSKWFKNEDLIEASLARKWQNQDIYSFFRNRITFPIYDTIGNIVAYSARILDPKDKPKYLNSWEHSAFEKSKILYWLNIAKKHIKEHNCLIVVEWQMDVIALYRLGFQVGVATCGTALSDEHIKLLKRYTENIYFLFDNDEAWQAATLRALKIAYQHSLYPKIIRLSEKYKDIDDVANEDDAKTKFNSFLNEAKDGFLSSYELLKSRSDLSSPIDKQKIFNTMFGMISWLENPSIQIHYLNLLADKVGQPYEVMNVQYKQFAKWEWKFFIQQTQKAKKKNSLYQPNRETIVLCLFYKDYISNNFEEIDDIKKIALLGEKIAQNIDQQVLGTVIKNQLDEDKKIEMEEAQLRREKEFQWLINEDDKLKLIKSLVWPYFQKILQQSRKDKNIDAKKVYEINQLMREIKR